jgi:hypothetical protein
VRQEVVRQEHGLRALQVGVAREVHVLRRLRARQQHLLQPVDTGRDRCALAPEEPSERGGDLVVAATTGVQLGAGGAGELGDASLDGGVDVLVGRRATLRDRRARAAGRTTGSR